jgi:hypothetical protein
MMLVSQLLVDSCQSRDGGSETGAYQICPATNELTFKKQPAK